MRALLVLALAVIPAVAQTPLVRLINATRPASRDFQIGDRFEILITGAANQPVNVRTTMNGRMDWGPVIGRTDMSGRWSTTGQFEKDDFGGWSEVWTVGGKLANPNIHFSVDAPCLKGGQSFQAQTGANMVLTCETAEGRQTFATQSGTGPFRTPDGRLIPGRLSNMTAEQYHGEIMQFLITSRANDVGSGQRGDEAGALIMKVIGVNALDEDEARNVLAIVRAAFEKPELIPQAAKEPSETLRLLRNLADSTGQPSLKQQIAETMAYVEGQ
jgi:hypothetical protein